RRDLNSHNLSYWNLNPARLPIPPLPQYHFELIKEMVVIFKLFIESQFNSCRAISKRRNGG
ncbi:hypothetical protein, partial [Pseudoalteromonas distincta]|uniref:hypothetical protein n=1 Tax=Pseudoalteromonas distincta TaxID=77608 RepID=UPI0034E86114